MNQPMYSTMVSGCWTRIRPKGESSNTNRSVFLTSSGGGGWECSRGCVWAHTMNRSPWPHL